MEVLFDGVTLRQAQKSCLVSKNPADRRRSSFRVFQRSVRRSCFTVESTRASW